jgi:hypothetical protein
MNGSLFILVGIDADKVAVPIETSDIKADLTVLAKKLAAKGIYTGMTITKLELTQE